MIKKLLIVPDSHANPKYDNERYEWLGKFILAERPDVIVNLGDFADMPSLSSYDRGKGSFEGRRYINDLKTTIEALAILDDYEQRAVAADKKAKRKPYAPRKEIILGNHEHRIVRAANDAPELVGTLSVNDLEYVGFGYNVTPYRKEVFIEDIAFSHDYATGVSGKAIGGEGIAKMLIAKNFMSSVQGHSHLYDHSERTRVDGRKLFGLSAGCWTHPDYVEDWNIQTHKFWWRGLVMLENVSEGYYDRINAITMRDIERM